MNNPWVGSLTSSLVLLAFVLGWIASHHKAMPPINDRVWVQQMENPQLPMLEAPIVEARPEVAGIIEVAAATYGGNCFVERGKVTGYVKQACDGLAVCKYTIDLVALGGDPAGGCEKSFEAEYRCASESPLYRRRLPPEAHGKTLALSCEAAP